MAENEVEAELSISDGKFKFKGAGKYLAIFLKAVIVIVTIVYTLSNTTFDFRNFASVFSYFILLIFSAFVSKYIHNEFKQILLQKQSS